MKVFISVDLEGVSGYVKWDEADRLRERELITGDVNAAIEGVCLGGASEVLVTEAHGNMRNLIPEKVDSRARFLSGSPKILNHMAGIDGSFDAALLIGYHSRAGTLNGVMSHTYAGSIFKLAFNSLEVGEIGADAAIAGAYGVPVVMVSGDEAACKEAQALLGDIETVSVKEGIGRFAAKCLPVDQARKRIKEAATKIAERADSVRPFVIEPPVRTEITFTDPSCADAASRLPFAKRIDGRTVSFESKTYLEAFKLFDAIHFLASVV